MALMDEKFECQKLVFEGCFKRNYGKTE